MINYEQVNDWLGADLDKIAARVRRGTSPCDMDETLQCVAQLLCEKIYPAVEVEILEITTEETIELHTGVLELCLI